MRVIGAALALTLSAGIASGQILSSTERLRLIQDQARVELAKKTYLDLPAAKGVQTDVGAWITVTGVDLRDDDHSSATPDAITHLILQDYRAWITQKYSDDVSLYARARVQKFNFGTLPGTVEPDTHVQERATVDLLYLDIGTSGGWNFRPGRQFQRVGRGLVLSADLDGIEVSNARGGWKHRGFAGSTLGRDPNVDTSVIGFDQGLAKRDFAFYEGEYRTERGPRYYGYGVVQHDRSKASTPVQDQRSFQYHSQYLGVGVDGRFDELLHYYVEAVHETGDALADLANDPRVKVNAAAALAGLLYYPRGDWHPLASLEYAWGSGDPARGSVTNTFGGKQSVNDDSNFLYFGAFDGGLALTPRLSNMHILRLGYQVKPWPLKDRILPELVVGGKVSAYFKDELDGVISDPLATLAASRVGTGIDLFVGARPASDLSLLAQYGRFMPGAAYPTTAQDAANRVLLTTTLSF